MILRITSYFPRNFEAVIQPDVKTDVKVTVKSTEKLQPSILHRALNIPTDNAK